MCLQVAQSLGNLHYKGLQVTSHWEIYITKGLQLGQSFGKCTLHRATGSQVIENSSLPDYIGLTSDPLIGKFTLHRTYW